MLKIENLSATLENAELSQINGAGDIWVRRSARIYTGRWGSYKRYYSKFLGYTRRNGKTYAKFDKRYTRQRTQTEVSKWFHYDD